ncbi:hypothetical protein FDG2_5148 [Candidatus Protofrankia californiensis]|uniref:Uncharacterized protein n=1 Tax=Candidatus Protofrankia californiensis TaxID=1839754 RepID=A0A1C3PBA2_9ACTN|nr:hypothetical protein FDG2_5148 [Candidatus Protofrankia californiensis]
MVSPNEQLRAARLRTGSAEIPGEPLSRQELAERVNRWTFHRDGRITEVDGNYIGKLERGVIRWPQRCYREALRAILRAGTDRDLGFHRPGRRPESLKEPDTVGLRAGEGEEEPVRRRGFLQLGGVLLATPHRDGQPLCEAAGSRAAATLQPGHDDHMGSLSYESLRTTVSRARRAYQSCRYGELDVLLPGLLAALDTVPDDHVGGETSLDSLRAQIYQVVASAELKRGNEGPAWLAADRSMSAAVRSGDPLDRASSARVVTHALMRARQFSDAATVAAGEAARLARNWEQPTPAAFSVYGALLLRGAVAAAQADDRGGAGALLEEAAEAARHVRGDGNERWTAFGPTNVALHRVHVAVVLGDAGTALAHARMINPETVVVIERRAALFLDIARAHSQRGSYSQAVEAIAAAERTAPEELAGRPASHRLIRHVLASTGGSAKQTMHEVAARVGVAA